MSSVFHPLHSSRRPSALKDTDYDHEINLIDHTQTATRSRSHSASEGDRRDSLSPPADSSARRYSDDQLRKKLTLREELERRRYSKPKYQTGRLGDDLNEAQGLRVQQTASNESAAITVKTTNDDDRPLIDDSSKQVKNFQADRESAIDILYENQRGGFLCGKPLFSSQALGAADFPAWTNIALKPSATNITNAQVPDPSWEWAWKGWSVNHTDEVDEDGWEYSFMFSKKFSWHGPTWYSSFVRRRAWVRKRVKKDSGYQVQEAHRLDSDYFTIHPVITRSRSPSKGPSIQETRYSVGQLASRDMGDVEDREDIGDIEHLMRALKLSRIDREKMEAVENFIKNGGDELYYLRERMHDIMSQFIFQASRRLLLAHLSSIYEEAVRHREECAKNGEEGDPQERQKVANLEAAVRAADEEVKRLEFWSDIKGMADKGETQGAVSDSQGWDRKKWAGLDDSGPKDVISDQELAGVSPEKIGDVSHTFGSGKGKEKA